jgi:hypothetical protein
MSWKISKKTQENFFNEKKTKDIKNHDLSSNSKIGGKMENLIAQCGLNFQCIEDSKSERNLVLLTTSRIPCFRARKKILL